MTELFVILPGGGPAHRQLREALRTAIHDGRLRPHDTLPSSRVLACDLGLSRWVVTEAYEQLIAEGYLVSRAGSRTRVAARAADAAAPAGRPPDRGRAPTDDTLDPVDPGHLDLRPGVPDLAKFPRLAWTRAYSQAVRRMSVRDLGYRDPRGAPVLRRTVAAYLARVRGIDARPEHVVITSGTTHSMLLLSRTLLSLGFTTLVAEDPGWPRLTDVAAAEGLQIADVGVDRDGLLTRVLPTRPAAVLVTPAHQFPTGVALSAQRRTSLVDWARRHDGLIVEDDYDAEFRYDGQPLGAVAGLEPERVTYLGSLSKTLAPGLGLGWMLLPSWLISAVVDTIPAGGAPDTLTQLTLTEFITRGDYDQHLRQMRRRYRQRRDALLEILQGTIPVVSRGVAAGLHVLIELGSAADEAAAAARLDQVGIRVMPLQRYRRSSPTAGLVVNFARLPPNRAADVARAIARAVTLGVPADHNDRSPGQSSDHL